MGDLILRVYYNNAWYDLDIDSNIPLRLDISAVENTSIGEIFGVGSQTFNLPGTRRNNAFFKGAYKVGADNIPGLYNTLDAVVLYNGEQLLSGEFQLEEILTDGNYISYNVTVADDTVNFKNTIEGTLINEIDWSEFDHTLTAPNITASWNGELFSGDIFYPLCDFGTDNPDDYPSIPRVQLNRNVFDAGIANPATAMEERQFLPAISARTVVNKIIDYAGFKYESTLISGSAFDDLYILPKGQEDLGIVFTGSTLQTFSATQNATQDIIDGNEDILEYNLEVSDPGNNYNPTTYTYTAPTAGDYDITAQATVFNPSLAGNPSQFTIRIYQNSVEVASKTITISYSDGPYKSVTVNFNGNAPVAGNTFTVTGEYAAGLNADSIIVVANFNNSFRCTSAPVAYTGADVAMGLQFDPKTKAYDILKGILTKFNAVIVPHPNESKKLIIESFEDWMQQGRNIDWTDRYDTSIRTSIKHPVNDQPKTLIIKDIDDADRFSKIAIDNAPNFQYGTQRVIAASNIPNGEKKIETTFAPIVLAPMIESGSIDLEGNPTFNLSTGSAVVPHLYKFDNKAQQTYQFQTRLGYKVEVDVPSWAGALGYIYIGQGSGQQQLSSYYTISNLKSLTVEDNTLDLNFDNSYFNLIPMYYDPTIQGKDTFDRYWKEYIDTLYWDENRKVTLSLEFSPTEYKNIRLNDRIFIHGEQYRINKISGYNLTQDDVVTVELLKQRPVYGEGQYITPTPTPTPVPTVTPTPTPANCDFELNIYNQSGCDFDLSIS